MASALGLGTVVVVAAIGIGSLGSGLGGPSVAPGAVTDAPSPSASPAASTAPVEPVAVTGAQTSELVHSFGSTVEEDGVYHTRLPWWTMTWEADDSRLSGEGTWVVNWNWLLEDGPSIGTAAYVLVNPGGRWVGTGQGYGDGSADHSLVVLHGEGDYDGLTATLLMRGDAGSITFEGMIFPFEPPEVPVTVEPPAD